MQEEKLNKGSDRKDKNKEEDKDKDNIYDKVIKENIEATFLPLTEKYLNFKIVESRVLEAKLQSTTEREVDLLRVVKTDKGEKFILHLEFQSQNEKRMIYRIKEYDAIIQRKHKLDIRHYVIFLGKGRMSMQTELEEKHVFRGFKSLSLNQLDFDEMIQSQIPEEIILAILSNFRGKDPEKIIRLIVNKLEKTSNNKADLKKFIKQLRILSKLRKLEKETIKTVKDMPIIYNLEEDYSYNQGIQKGIEQGIEQERKRGQELLKEMQEHLKEMQEQERRKAIIAMLPLGITPEQIAEQLDVPIEFIKKIQKELN